MSVESSILFIADTCQQRKATADALVHGSDYRVFMAAHDAEAIDVLKDAHVDLILADVENRDCDIVQFLARLRFTHPDLVRVLLVGEEANIKLSDALARTAAYQYLTKPLLAEQTCLVVKRALETRELARRHRRLVRELKIGEDSHFLHGRPDTPMKGEASHFERLVYASEAMSELCGLAREAARTDLPILIEGETGTGKELLARALHFHSRRSSSPLMVQNCGGMRRPRTQHQEHGIGGGLMCKTCGCDGDAKVTVTNLQTGNEERMERSAPVTPPHHAHDHHHDHHHHDNYHHGHEPHDHDHAHNDHDHAHHDHDHSHAPQPAALAAVAGLHTVTVDIERAILDKNDRLAERNRAWFEGREILALNLVSSPGAGKTTLLERAIRDLKNEMPISVIEGDQQTLNDAERIKAAGAPAVQVNTGTGCHLEADMIRRGLDSLRPAFGSVLMIENVGNLVCPALFDLGERAKVVVLSVTEGDDKPLKYPHMFKAAELMVISKIDLAPHVDFDISRCEARAREVNPEILSIRLSARTGEGLGDWYEWLRAARRHLALAAAQ